MSFLVMFSPTGLILTIVLIAFSAIVTASLFKRYYFTNLSHLREVATLKAENENRLLRAKVETQEQTFQDLSRDIHDDIGQKLSLVRLYVDQSKDENLKEVPEILSGVISHLRDLSKSLSADVVKRDGLFVAIESDIIRLNRLGTLEAKLERSEQMYFLSDDIEIIVYRIYQEAVQNILKHSGASKLLVHLQYDLDLFTLQISDNGNGFKENAGSGQGLKNIELRTKSIGGTSSIETDKRGTYLIIKIPINKHGKDKNIHG